MGGNGEGTGLDKGAEQTVKPPVGTTEIQSSVRTQVVRTQVVSESEAQKKAESEALKKAEFWIRKECKRSWANVLSEMCKEHEEREALEARQSPDMPKKKSMDVSKLIAKLTEEATATANRELLANEVRVLAAVYDRIAEFVKHRGNLHPDCCPTPFNGSSDEKSLTPDGTGVMIACCKEWSLDTYDLPHRPPTNDHVKDALSFTKSSGQKGKPRERTARLVHLRWALVEFFEKFVTIINGETKVQALQLQRGMSDTLAGILEGVQTRIVEVCVTMVAEMRTMDFTLDDMDYLMKIVDNLNEITKQAIRNPDLCQLATYVDESKVAARAWYLSNEHEQSQAQKTQQLWNLGAQCNTLVFQCDKHRVAYKTVDCCKTAIECVAKELLERTFIRLNSVNFQHPPTEQEACRALKDAFRQMKSVLDMPTLKIGQVPFDPTKIDMKTLPNTEEEKQSVVDQIAVNMLSCMATFGQLHAILLQLLKGIEHATVETVVLAASCLWHRVTGIVACTAIEVGCAIFDEFKNKKKAIMLTFANLSAPTSGARSVLNIFAKTLCTDEQDQEAVFSVLWQNTLRFANKASVLEIEFDYPNPMDIKVDSKKVYGPLLDEILERLKCTKKVGFCQGNAFTYAAVAIQLVSTMESVLSIIAELNHTHEHDAKLLKSCTSWLFNLHVMVNSLLTKQNEYQAQGKTFHASPGGKPTMDPETTETMRVRLKDQLKLINSEESPKTRTHNYLAAHDPSERLAIAAKRDKRQRDKCQEVKKRCSEEGLENVQKKIKKGMAKRDQDAIDKLHPTKQLQ